MTKKPLMTNNQNQMPFSGAFRDKYFEKLQSQTFDLVVIGGGATGCGIALDASSRGMRVALVEKSDFGSGTSSKSTKLIHGGLRYLKQLEFGLVRETGSERAIVHKLASHLVLPEKMLMPIVKNGTYGKLAASFGVKIYDILAGVNKEDGRKMLSSKETVAIEPLVDPANLKGACYYSEYRTDDARLTIELVKRAVSFGCIALNYCQVDKFIYQNGKVSGVSCIDVLTSQPIVIKAKATVSACGPWVDNLRELDKSKKGSQLHLTKGVHLVFPHSKIPLKNSMYFDIEDGRMIFAIPRGRVTYVGTSDTDYVSSIDRVVATKKDAEYILKAVNQTFPNVELDFKDIISNWAGLRPLIHQEGKSPSELSRKDEIFQSESGLISIAGGKLTGYRKMAQRIVDLVSKKLHADFKSCSTSQIFLVEDALKGQEEVEEYLSKRKEDVKRLNLEQYYAWYLVTTYGKQSQLILEFFKQFDDSPEIALARAEVKFGVENEMITSLSDYFVRRTGRLYFDIQTIPIIRDAVTRDISLYLKWDSSRIEIENKNLDVLIFDAENYHDLDIEQPA